jgi:LPXTG-motif cell wall-anchored protein
MFNLLAQAITDVATGTGSNTQTVAAGGVITLSGVAWYLLRRKVGKVCDHIDDSAIHVRQGNGYVTPLMCAERRAADEKLLDERHTETCRRLDEIATKLDRVLENGKQ